MKFGNPTSAAAVQAATSASVQNALRSLYWPQISGQQFAPALSPNAGYNPKYGVAAITLGDAASNGRVTFPAASRFVGSLKTCTVVAQLAIDNVFGSFGSVGPQNFLYSPININGGAGVYFQIQSSISPVGSTVTYALADSAGNFIANPWFSMSNAGGVWIVITTTMNPDSSGSVVVTDLNGNVLASHNFASGAFPLTASSSRIGISFGPPDAANTGTNNYETIIGPLSVTYS